MYVNPNSKEESSGDDFSYLFFVLSVYTIIFALKKSADMKIFTTQEIREIEQYTIDTENVTTLELIERVAEGVSCEIAAKWNTSKPLAVFAGPDSNGAYALATARLLAEQGFRPEVFLFNIGGDKLTEDCAAERSLVKDAPGVDFVEIDKTFSLPRLDESYLVVDGLFGCDISEPLSGGFTILVQYINESKATVVAIDIPSGLAGEWNPGIVSRNVIHAHLTLAIQFPHLAFFISDYSDLVGEWKVLDIGLSSHKIRTTQAQYHIVERGDVKRMLTPRNLNCSKADFGSVMIFAGSYGMMGAAVLAGKGALRSGAGKVTIYSPRCGFNILQTAIPEAMFKTDLNDLVIGEIVPGAKYTSVAIGPGIGTSDRTIRALDEFLAAANKPVILDADALNCIAARPSMLNSIPVLSIITPHAGEFDRLFGAQSCMDARLRKAIEMAMHYKFFIILKGRYTAVVRPDGKIYFNSSGSPAMATPGSGDVLTGVLGGFMAQPFSPEYSSIIATYVHGVAGELAAEEHGTYGVTAGDIADNIGRAIKLIMTNNSR